MFYRTIRLVENGIEPVFVFDGRPPELKWLEIQRRAERRKKVRRVLEEIESCTNSTMGDRIVKRSLKTGENEIMGTHCPYFYSKNR